VPAEADLVVVRQNAFDIVQTELDQLVTVHRAFDLVANRVDRVELVDLVIQRPAPLIYLFDGPFGPRFRGIIPQQRRFARNGLHGEVDNRAVQVSDSTTNGGAPAARTDELTAGDADAVRRGGRAGTRFRDTLKRGGGSDETTLSDAATAAAAGPAWFRPEPIRMTPPPSRIAPMAPAKIDRVLIGSSGGDAEARIRIGAGALAGSEIRLTAAAGSQAVTAQLLTPAAGSRETLSVAIEEIRLRLRDKGIVLASSVARSRAGGDPRRDGTTMGEPDESGAGAGSSSRWPAAR
jgi:hypothetical protein